MKPNKINKSDNSFNGYQWLIVCIMAIISVLMIDYTSAKVGIENPLKITLNSFNFNEDHTEDWHNTCDRINASFKDNVCTYGIYNETKNTIAISCDKYTFVINSNESIDIEIPKTARNCFKMKESR